MKLTKFQIRISLNFYDNNNIPVVLSKKIFKNLEQSIGYQGSFFENTSSSKYITIFKSPFVYKKAKSTYAYKNSCYLYVAKNLDQYKVNLIVKQLGNLKVLSDCSVCVFSC